MLLKTSFPVEYYGSVYGHARILIILMFDVLQITIPKKLKNQLVSVVCGDMPIETPNLSKGRRLRFPYHH